MSAPRVGVIGGGQLARMMQPAAINLGIHLRVLAQSSKDSAAQVIPDTVIGSHHDWKSLEQFAAACDVLTFDHEHVPTEYLFKLQEIGVKVRPGPHALRFAQDKIAMREVLTKMGVPCPQWKVLNNLMDSDEFANSTGYPFIIKTARGGYDGKGVWIISDKNEAEKVLLEIKNANNKALGEMLVPFDREIAAQVARNPQGQTVSYSIVQSTQTDGICHEVISPCPDLSPERSSFAQEIAVRISTELDVIGILAVEMFDTGTEILVNELAMRPHNSGHWSMDGSITSQFENHLRAILDLPLGSPENKNKATVMVNLLGGENDKLEVKLAHVLALDPDVKVHLYGKSVKLGRKVGHVNVSGENIESLQARAWRAATELTGVNK